jgi:hypothetical protein
MKDWYRAAACDGRARRTTSAARAALVLACLFAAVAFLAGCSALGTSNSQTTQGAAVTTEPAAASTGETFNNVSTAPVDVTTVAASSSTTGITTTSEPVAVATSSTVEAKTSASETAIGAAANGLANALSDMCLAGISWTYEPAGDITGDTGTGQLVFAFVSKVSADGTQVTFDAKQLYLGDPAASQAAARDKAGELTAPMYVRNAVKHPQTLALASDATVVLQYPSEADIAFGGATRPPLAVVSAKEFGSRFQQESRFTEAQVGFWIVVADNAITTMVEVYSP